MLAGHPAHHCSSVSDDQAPDLARTLGKVPELLQSCLTSWVSRGFGIRQLRLVSKDVGSGALQAVQSCSLQVGDEAQPDPHQLVQLMSFAHLKEVKIKVLIISGEPSSVSSFACSLSARLCGAV